jgi:pilus assembly protein Flp/PilA
LRVSAASEIVAAARSHVGRACRNGSSLRISIVASTSVTSRERAAALVRDRNVGLTTKATKTDAEEFVDRINVGARAGCYVAATFGRGDADNVLPGGASDSHVDLRSDQMHSLFSRFVKDESGATAIEYGLIAAGISVVIITAVKLVGTNLTTTFNSVANAVK